MSEPPLVSVIVPNYQTDEYLETALESALDQTHDPLEVVLIDSSGTETVRELAELDDCIEYLYQEPCGLADARNYGISESSGEYIAFLDADDYWMERKTETQLRHLQSTSVDVVYSDEYIVNDGEEQYHSTLPVEDSPRHYIEFFRRGSGIPVRTVLGRRECFEDYQFEETLRAREDSNLWVRLFREYRPSRVPEPLASKLVRDDAMTADVDMMYESELASIEHLVERIPELEYWREERLARTHYKYGKQLLEVGRDRDAREALRGAIEADETMAKAYVLFLLTALPVEHSTARALLDWLEAGYDAVWS